MKNHTGCDLQDIRTLKPHPKNRNKHSPEQIERLAKILKYQGWRYPIKVSKRSGFITSGHGRLLAAMKIPVAEVPVSFQDYDSDEQEYADVQSDNAIASWAELDLSLINSDIGELGPDFDIDLLGIKDFTLDVSEKGNCDEDEIPEEVLAKTKLGDLYLLGDHRLLCGDSTEIDQVERLMNGEKTDMVFTDPPYGIDIFSQGTALNGSSKKYGSALAHSNSYRPIIGDKDLKVVKTALPWCLKQKNCVLWGANNYPQHLPPSNGWLVWDKEQHANFGDCELAYTNSPGAIRQFTHKWVGFQKDSERGEVRVHPTQKPVALAEWAFELFKTGKVIVDLFGGSGSTLIACEKTNRKCFMMEIDPHYCDVIVARWEKYTGKHITAQLTNG